MGGAVLSLLKPMEREKNIDIDPSWVLAFDRRQPPDSPLRAGVSVAPIASSRAAEWIPVEEGPRLGALVLAPLARGIGRGPAGYSADSCCR